jgi:hypothetical protein
VIVDLDDCILVQPRPLDAFDGARATADVELCFVSRRLTCRQLLARAGLAHRYAVFTRVGDALQARRFAEEGHGCGWRIA